MQLLAAILLTLTMHESPDCVYRVSVVETPGHYELTDADLSDELCVGRFGLAENGWVWLFTPQYTVGFKLPEDAGSGFLTYKAGRGTAIWDDGKVMLILAFIFLAEEI